MHSPRWSLCAAYFVLAGCGSSTTTPDSPDTSTPSDVGVDTNRDTRPDAPIDTAKPYEPRAPRCVPPDAGPPSDAASDSIETGSDDASLDTTDTTDAADVGAPTPTASPPQVVSSGGRVLVSPRVIPITYDGYEYRDEAEDFVASFGCTAWWRAIANEYGVFDAYGGTPIHLSEAPPDVITDHQIETFLRKNITAKTPGWELPTRDSIYAIYYPSSTTIRLSTEESCTSFGGYHKSFNLADGTSVAYAVMPDCYGDFDAISGASSHEFIEAATDPEPYAAPAYQRVDDDHAVYGMRIGTEVGDMCEREEGGGMFFPTDYPFMVQRSWSNLAATNKHDPCVPALSGTYFNTLLELPDTVSAAFASTTTKGVIIPVGSERTIYLQLFADGPIDSWTLSAKDISGETPHLSFTFEKTTGKSGDRIGLTISKSSVSTRYDAEPFAVYSSNGKHRHVAYGVVGH